MSLQSPPFYAPSFLFPIFDIITIESEVTILKLNYDSVRELLLELEENLNLIDQVELNQENSSEDKLYAAMKLIEAGFIDGKTHRFMGGDFMIWIKSITWEGHQFLDNIRPKTSWETSKTTAAKIGGASIKILSDIAAKVTADLINSQLGH